MVKLRAEQMKTAKNQAFDTVALWGLYGKEDMARYKSLTLPLFMTTAGGPYDSLVDGALLLSYQTTNDPNKIYSRIDNINPELDSRFVKFDWNNHTSFDGWVTISSIGSKKQIKIPIKRTRHFNKLYSKAKLKHGIRISKDSITFIFESSEIPKVKVGVLG